VAESAWRRELRTFAFDALHLVVLSSFAIARPLFQVLGAGASFFAVRGSSAGQIVEFALAVGLGLGVALALAEALALVVLGRRGRRVVHVACVWALVGLMALEGLKRSGVDSAPAAFGAAAAIGLLAAVLYTRWRPARTTVSVLAPAPLIFVALFLFQSPVVTLVRPSHVTAARAAGVQARTPVVVLVLDEFNAAGLMTEDGRIDAGRYPNFAELAGTSTWFENAITVNLATTWAVPAILSGRASPPHSLPVYRDHPNNLFTLLGRDYRLNVHETQTRLCPPRLCPDAYRVSKPGLEGLASDVEVVYGHMVLPRQLAERLPTISTSWGDFEGQAAGQRLTQTAGFESFVRSLSPPTSPAALSFLHVELPHFPYSYLPSGRQYRAPLDHMPGLEGELWGPTAILPLQAQQRFLLQVGYVDRLLGRLMRRMRALGLFDRAVFVVTADHGVSFHPGAGRRTALRFAEDLAFVPLFVKAPGQRRGRVVKRVVQTVDILPTVADLVGARIPFRIDGRSALGNLNRRRIQLENRSYDSATLVARRDAELVRQARSFGTGLPWRRVFAIGRNADLVGSPAPATATASPTLHAELDDADLYSVVGPGLPVPSFVGGRVSGRRAAAGLDVVVAVNGTIAGVGATYERAGLRFAALVPETAYRRGANAVSVYAVRRGRKRELELIGGRAAAPNPPYTLRKDSIAAPGGRRIAIVPGAVAGYVEDVVVRGRLVRVAGWAGKSSPPRIRDQILVFAGGRLVHVDDRASPGSRQDLPPGLQTGGFDFTIPDVLLRDHRDVRIFAVVGSEASELPRIHPYPWEE
jgi:hypothetical protein